MFTQISTSFFLHVFDRPTSLKPFFLAIFTFILLYLGHRALSSPLSKLPGPFHTRLTSVILIWKELTSQRRTYVHSLHEQYGPVIRIGPNEVSFTSLEAIKEIYSSGGSGYDKTEFYTLFMQFGERTMFSTLGKEGHSKKKRHIGGQYANTNIMRPEVVSGIQERADAFLTKCTKSEGKSLNVYEYLHCYALDCASHHLFHPYGTHSIEGGEDWKMMEEQSYHNSIIQNFTQYYSPTLSTILDLIFPPRPSPIANAYVHSSVKKAETTSPYSLANKLHKSKEFTDLQTAADCMDHLAAGIDTTGDALCFLMYAISLPTHSSQSIQRRLISELQTSKSKSIDELPYLDAVIKEGLRCFPPIPMSQPRYVPSGGRVISGVFVPEHTIVSVQAWSVHRLNPNIYPDGCEFKPERWIDSPPEEVLEMNRLFFAFGMGGRGCTGRHLALAEMKILLREVYSKFQTRLEDGFDANMELSDQVISSRPMGQSCGLVFERLKMS